MRTTLLIAALASANLAGQSSADVKVDNPKVRVIGVTDQPHQPGTMQEHPMGRVFIYLDAGKTTRTMPDGKVETIEYKAGDVRWNPPSTYKAENVSDHPVRIVVVEPKSKGPYSQSSTKLDPAALSPEHYRVEFENEQVRVFRVLFGPHTKGIIHEHILDRAVIQVKVSEGGKIKPGDASMSGYAIHIDSNDTDQPQERIAVELK